MNDSTDETAEGVYGLPFTTVLCGIPYVWKNNVYRSFKTYAQLGKFKN